MQIKNLFDKKLLKFLMVGIINTMVGAGIMFLLYNVFNVSYWISSAANYIIGGIVSFVLNKFFTFNNHSKSAKQIIYFIVTVGICYIIAYIIAKEFVLFIFSSYSDKIKDNIAMLFGMCIYTGLNYIIQCFFIFKDNSEYENDKE